MTPFIKTANSISFALDGKHHTFTTTMPQYPGVVLAIRSDDMDALRKAMDVGITLRKAMDVGITVEKKSFGQVTVKDGVVFYKDSPIHNTVVDRLFNMLADGFDITPIANFLNNLMDNPSSTAVEELYLFLEASKLPITADGHFLAYKVVRSDYMSKHQGGTPTSNKPGETPEMPRNQVDDKRDNHCSRGLHFCGFEYMKSFYRHGDRVVSLKINPADVVSIPSDYNNAKGRTWKYQVHEDITDSVDVTSFESSVMRDTAYSDLATNTIKARIASILLDHADEENITHSEDDSDWKCNMNRVASELMGDLDLVEVRMEIEEKFDISLPENWELHNLSLDWTLDSIADELALYVFNAQDEEYEEEEDEYEDEDSDEDLESEDDGYNMSGVHESTTQVVDDESITTALNMVYTRPECPNDADHMMHSKGAVGTKRRYRCVECQEDVYIQQ